MVRTGTAPVAADQSRECVYCKWPNLAVPVVNRQSQRRLLCTAKPDSAYYCKWSKQTARCKSSKETVPVVQMAQADSAYHFK